MTKPATASIIHHFSSIEDPKVNRQKRGKLPVETRTVVRVTDDIAWPKERHTWPGLQSIITVAATRESNNKVSEETTHWVLGMKI